MEAYCAWFVVQPSMGHYTGAFYTAKASNDFPSTATELVMDGSRAERIFRSVWGESNALTTRSATSSRWMLPIAVLSSVKMAFPVIGSDTRPPGRIIVQFTLV